MQDENYFKLLSPCYRIRWSVLFFKKFLESKDTEMLSFVHSIVVVSAMQVRDEQSPPASVVEIRGKLSFFFPRQVNTAKSSLFSRVAMLSGSDRVRSARSPLAE